MATVSLPLPPEAALQGAAGTFPEYKKINGTNQPVSGLYFDGTNTETAHWRFPILGYGSGNLTLTVRWYADTASSGAVFFEAGISAITPNTDTQDAETDAYATATNATDTHLGTVGQRVHEFDITISNLDSIANRDEVELKLSRVPSNAGDTMSGDCVVTRCILAYSDT